MRCAGSRFVSLGLPLVAVSTMVSPAVGQTVRAFGVDHGPVGPAVLALDDYGDLSVVNAAGGGEYGVLFETGEAMSASASYHIETETPADTFVETRFVHGPGSTAVRMVRGDHGYWVENDFAAFGAATFGVDVYLDGALVLHEEGLGDGDVFIESDEEWSIFCWTIKCRYCQWHGNEYYWAKEEDEAAAPSRFVTIGGDTIEADRIVFLPEGDGGGLGPVTSVETIAAGIEAFTVRSAGLGYGSQAIEVEPGHQAAGLSHGGIGGVALAGEAGGAAWTMSEFDDDGEMEEGAQIILAYGASGWSAMTAPIDDAAPDGSMLTMRSLATIDGVRGQEAATGRGTRGGGSLSIGTGFYGEPDGAMQEVEVRAGGEVVGSFETAGGAIVVAGAWPDLWSVEGVGCAGGCGEDLAVRYGWSGGPVLLEVDGQLVDGDEVVVRPLEIVEPIESMTATRVEVLAAGLESATFVEEAVSFGISCAADLNGDGELSVLDFVAFQQLFQAGDDAADVNGDGMLGVLDFVAYQQLFVVGCG